VRIPETDGEKAPLMPEPATEAEVLLARAEPAARPVEPAGLLRAEPCAPLEARANDRDVAPDIDRPATARAAPLLTPDTDARVPDTDGEKVPLAPEPATEAEVLLARAEPAARPLEPAGLFRAEPCAPLEARANDRDVAPDIDRPATARAAPLLTPDTDARVPDTDGEKVPLAPEPATEAEVLLARAEPAARPLEPAGLFRAEPCAPLYARASDRDVAPDIDRPASARAPLLCTPGTAARVPDTDGEKDPLTPEPDTAAETLLALAEPVARLIDPVGLLRAVPCALAVARAIDWEDTPDMDWPVSARAPLLRTADTAARDPDTEGENDALAPVALALLGTAALFAEAAAD
jgi:hypothetical protein